MVLDHVAQRAGVVVVGGATADAEVLCDGDLDVVDRGAVPQRLEDPVREAEHEQVLHRLLAEVVVDAEHLSLVERRRDAGVQLARGREIVPEGLLDQQPGRRVCPAAEADLRELRRDLGEVRRRDREVEEPLRRAAVVAVARVEPVGEVAVEPLAAERAGHDADARLERLPQRRVELVAGVALDRLACAGAEGGVVVPPARDAEDAEALRQPPVGEQVVDGRQQLARGEVAGRAEQHQRRGRRQPLLDVLGERVLGDERRLDRH